jgi:hypothetical protein
MRQINLFESLDERERRNEEIRHPVLLFRRTSGHVLWLLVLCIALAAMELVFLRLLYGVHDQGEEIVVITTPILLGYLCIRLLRTQMQPAEPSEVDNLPKPKLRDLLGAIFALGLILMALLIASALIYRHFEIPWATQAALLVFREGCIAMTVLAGIIFIASNQGRRQAKKVIRVSIAIPGICGRAIRSALAPFLPRPRRPAWRCVLGSLAARASPPIAPRSRTL